MAKRTLEQNVRFHALINELRYDCDEKALLVQEFSGQNSTSSKDLEEGEMRRLIDYLEGQKLGSIKKMRSKIINIAKDIGLLLPDGGVSFERLNVFLEGKFKKKLHQLQRDELPKAITAMEAWRATNMKKELQL